MEQGKTVSSGFSVNEVHSVEEENEEIRSETKTEDVTVSENLSNEPSKEQTSQSSSRDFNRNPSLISSTTSSTLIVPNIEGDTMEIGAYHFSPGYTKNYTDIYDELGKNTVISKEKRLEEFEDVFNNGYFNTVILDRGSLMDEEVWGILERYNIKVWCYIYSLYDSKSQTIEEFMENYDFTMEYLRKNKLHWEMFNGFVYDESCHRGQSVKDFNSVCEYVYKKYGKRNFPVFAANEISDLWDAPELGEMAPEGFKYVTDVAFDVYTIDVRKGADNGNLMRDANAAYSEITDGDSFFRVITNEMLKMAGHSVNVWFYPSGHNYGKGDEQFCLAHLKYFENLLKEQEHPGGMIIYTYTQWDAGVYGLQSHLDLGSSAEKTIRRYENQVWYEYSSYLKELTLKFRKTKTDLITDPTK